MKKPHLFKRLSKYKVKKCIIEIPSSSKEEIQKVLKGRQYVECPEYWLKGFVKVIVLDSFIQISHNMPNSDSKGVKCFYDKDVLIEFLRHFEK